MSGRVICLNSSMRYELSNFSLDFSMSITKVYLIFVVPLPFKIFGACTHSHVLCVCACVLMHVLLCGGMHTCANFSCVFMFVCMCAHMHVQTSCVCMCVLVCVCTHACASFSHVCVCLCVHMCTCKLLMCVCLCIWAHAVWANPLMPSSSFSDVVCHCDPDSSQGMTLYPLHTGTKKSHDKILIN